MLNKFREELEQLIYDHAQVGIKLKNIEYDIVNEFSTDDKGKVVCTKVPENLRFDIEVNNG